MKPEKQIILYNGTYISESEKCGFQNRAFLYGDMIFETFAVKDRTILFFEEHLKRLIAGMKIIKFDIPERFSRFPDLLKEDILGLLNKNKLFKSSSLTIYVFRNSGQSYIPDSGKTDYLITCKSLNTNLFTLNSKGLTVSDFTDIKKPLNIFAPHNTGNTMLYNLAGMHARKTAADNCLIFNEENKVIEAIDANIFIVKNKLLISPPIEDGCIKGVMRKQIILSAKKAGIQTIEQSIFEKDLWEAEELFLSSSTKGIEWVIAYKNKRYYKRSSDFLIKKLNEQS